MEAPPSTPERYSRRRLAFRPLRGKPTDQTNLSLENSQNSATNAGEKPENGRGGLLTPDKAPVSGKLGIMAAQQQQGPTVSSAAGNDPAVVEQGKRKAVTWTFAETIFEKFVGKDFEAISKLLARKKIQRDKQQVRNHYFNMFKLGCSKAQLEEADWSNVPQDARELFVVLNNCEWKKRTGAGDNNKDSSYATKDNDPARLRQLILDGSVTLKNKRKKSSFITIRTPHCAPLLRFFPFHRKNSEVPTHIDLKLLPLNYKDRAFVCQQCEQNPYVRLRVNINDQIASIFEFLRKKWQRSIDRVAAEHGMMTSREELQLRLFIGENHRVHRVVAEVTEDPGGVPILSLRRLRGDLGRQPIGNGEDIEIGGEQGDASNGEEATSNVVRLNSEALKEVFEIDEAKIKEGLSEKNVGKASLLQLFFLLGKNETIVMHYEIIPSNNVLTEPDTQPWNVFISLVNREYDNLMAKSTAYIGGDGPSQQHQQQSFVSTDNQQQQQQPETFSHYQNKQQQNQQNLQRQQGKRIQNLPPSTPLAPQPPITATSGAARNDRGNNLLAANGPFSAHQHRQSHQVPTRILQRNTSNSPAMAVEIPPSLADEEIQACGFAEQIRAIRERPKERGKGAGRPPKKRQIKLIVDNDASKRICPPPAPTAPTVISSPMVAPGSGGEDFPPGAQLYYVPIEVASTTSTTQNVNNQPGQQQLVYIIATPATTGAAGNPAMVVPSAGTNMVQLSANIDNNGGQQNTIPYFPMPEPVIQIHQQQRIPPQQQVPSLQPRKQQQKQMAPPPVDFSHMVPSSSNSNSRFPQQQQAATKASTQVRAYGGSGGRTPATTSRIGTPRLPQSSSVQPHFNADYASMDGNSNSLLNAPTPMAADGGSPSKSLNAPDNLISHMMEQMINQNSVDFCRNFEQLTKMTKKAVENGSNGEFSRDDVI